jgi:predicted O-methyltransferase YrrM
VTTTPARFLAMDERLYRYVLEHSVREPEVLADLRAETLTMAHAGMQIGADQGRLMALLAVGDGVTLARKR